MQVALAQEQAPAQERREAPGSSTVCSAAAAAVGAVAAVGGLAAVAAAEAEVLPVGAIQLAAQAEPALVPGSGDAHPSRKRRVPSEMARAASCLLTLGESGGLPACPPWAMESCSGSHSSDRAARREGYRCPSSSSGSPVAGRNAPCSELSALSPLAHCLEPVRLALCVGANRSVHNQPSRFPR